jgi:hypothetical protein
LASAQKKAREQTARGLQVFTLDANATYDFAARERFQKPPAATVAKPNQITPVESSGTTAVMPKLST